MKLNKNQTELLNWLIGFASDINSENICLVEGFSGLGKTSIARQLQIKSIPLGYKAVLITLPDGSLSIDDFFLELASELSLVDNNELEEAISKDRSLTLALRSILEKGNLWIIIDELQNVANHDGKLMEEVERLIANISIHSTKGKIIAFTNQVIQRGKWSDQVTFKKLNAFIDSEAISRLNELLKEKNIKEKVEEKKKVEIIRVLGNNPRAINIFTERLRWASSLDELIGELPEIWEARDQEFSPHLLKELEEQLIRKSLERFTHGEIRILEGLSVMRKPFQKEAIERMPINADEAIRIREKFLQYFFLENNLSWLSFHPILKEICKLRLSKDKGIFKGAHSKAAEYYTRHFTHSTLKNIGKLGGYFVEARYHLIMSESVEKLEEISSNFEYFIRTSIKPGSPVPMDPQLLDERIGLLTAFLGSGGPKRLEYHLSKCFFKRGLDGDDKHALIHVERSIGLDTPVENWLLKMKLDEKLNGLFIAIDTGYKAIDRNKTSRILYQSCAELMDKSGQADEAIKLLKEGIEKIPAAKSVVSLYQFCAELMDKSGKVDEAIKLLKEGISKIPAANSVVSLYQFCAELMDKTRQADKAIRLLKEGIAKIPAANNAFSLYQLCAELMDKAGQSEKAINLLKEGIAKIPAANSVVSLYQFCAELMDKTGQVNEAINLLKEGILKIPAANSVVSLYQFCAELMDKSGQTDESINLLKEGIAKIPAANNVFSLYQLCAKLMDKAGQVDEAIKLLKVGIAKIPITLGGYKLSEQVALISYRDLNINILNELSADSSKSHQSIFASLLTEYAVGNFQNGNELLMKADSISKNSIGLITQAAFGLLVIGRNSEAGALLSNSNVQSGYDFGTTWLLALHALKSNDDEKARLYYEELTKLKVKNQNITINDLVKFWYNSKNERLSPSYFFPHLPTALTGYAHKLSVNSKTLENDVNSALANMIITEVIPQKEGLNILAISTEWFSRNGGLSTFNRQLCKTLAQLKHKVFCLLPAASDIEKHNALLKNVTLIEASASPGLNDLERLSLPPKMFQGFVPDIIIGHDRITGPSMIVQKENYFKLAKSVLFIHTAPGEIEWYKPISDDKTLAQKAEVRERLQIDLAKKADLVVAVGKKLFDEISTQLSGIQNHTQVTQFNPGIFAEGISANPKEVSPIPFCLLLGRVEDFELKGVDIAAKALDIVYKNWLQGNKPVLVIRGAMQGSGDKLRNQVKKMVSNGLDIRVKEYTSDIDKLKEEMRRASLVIMPSKTEGFGLVGLEAISVMCPVLISSNSGLAKMLQEFTHEEFHNWVVTTTGNVEADSIEWAKRVEFILSDRAASNNRIKTLYDKLSNLVNWEKSVKELLSLV